MSNWLWAAWEGRSPAGHILSCQPWASQADLAPQGSQLSVLCCNGRRRAQLRDGWSFGHVATPSLEGASQ